MKYVYIVWKQMNILLDKQISIIYYTCIFWTIIYLFEQFYFSTKIHVVDKHSGEEISSRNPPLGGAGKLYDIVAVPNVCPAGKLVICGN